MLFSVNPCNASFLLSIGRGSLSTEHISAAAATCEMLWPNHGWHNYNIFVGLNITERCPAMKQCSNHTNWTNGWNKILLLLSTVNEKIHSLLFR